MQCELCLCDKCVIERQLQSEHIDGLRDAVRVLAEEVSAWGNGNFATHQCQLPNGGECTGCKASERRQRATNATMANPIASAAVREAGR